MDLQADLDLMSEFDTGEAEAKTEAGSEAGLDYYYNMMLPELEEGKFTSDEKLEFVKKVLSV